MMIDHASVVTMTTITERNRALEKGIEFRIHTIAYVFNWLTSVIVCRFIENAVKFRVGVLANFCVAGLATWHISCLGLLVHRATLERGNVFHFSIAEKSNTMFLEACLAQYCVARNSLEAHTFGDRIPNRSAPCVLRRSGRVTIMTWSPPGSYGTVGSDLFSAFSRS